MHTVPNLVIFDYFCHHHIKLWRENHCQPHGMAWHRNNASPVGPMGWRGTEITPYTSTPWGGVAANVLSNRTYRYTFAISAMCATVQSMKNWQTELLLSQTEVDERQQRWLTKMARNTGGTASSHTKHNTTASFKLQTDLMHVYTSHQHTNTWKADNEVCSP